MKAVPVRRYLLFAAVVAVGCAIDLLTKRWVFDSLGMPHVNRSYWLWNEVFGFTTSLNEGALFGIGRGKGIFFSALSIVAATAIVYWLFVARAAHDLLLTLALALVTGGICGNLYDRLGLPGLTWSRADGVHQPGEKVLAVRDWLDFRLIDWPIFNIADSLLVCGAALLIWHALRFEPARAAGESAEP